MLPYISLFGHGIPTYSLLGAVGFLLGFVLLFIRCPRFGLSRDDGVYIYVFAGLGMLLGAKLLSLLPRLPQLLGDLPMLWTGQKEQFIQQYLSSGMVFYGGLFGALAGAVLSARFFKLRPSSFFPVLVPLIPLFHVFGRLGCFCAGCCYGAPADPPLGVLWPDGVARLPVQLWECAGEAVIFLFLLWYARRKVPPGRVLWAYLLAYAPLRFVLEFFRGDAARGIYGVFSTSQWISLGILAAAALWFLLKGKGLAHAKARP